MNPPRFSFGDRLRHEKAAESKGVAATLAIVHGKTTPSITGVEVTGNATEDFAVAVMVEGHSQALWFAENLLEFVAGTTMRIGHR